jgi:hypothetical protein
MRKRVTPCPALAVQIPRNFFLEQRLALDGQLMFALELLMGKFDLPESLVLFAHPGAFRTPRPCASMPA